MTGGHPPKSENAMLNFAELETRGWASVGGVSSAEALVALGKLLGSPLPSPNGEMVKAIKVTAPSEARPGSQSFIYGRGPFPLHTDTIFWPLPARYVLLRGSGDTRRPTIVRTIESVVRECGDRLSELADRSIWLVGKGSGNLRKFYCSLRFRQGWGSGWRYDMDCMTPANAPAAEVNEILRPLVTAGRGDCIRWSRDTAVVLANWKVLHGRGPEPDGEGIRIIERLYVA
jgi:hypothetical protein